ncbi:hypothetical protein ERJ75_001214600 [Trypanosoma vivax]|uniref:Uncharacterized protein n=1 Tax=Trypanosoma vivax (strain Y486) TaxID=1055687 RepID=F9WT04_TRYVY|nr:hypothetical protein ERJ75_001214600 [Trypanosoma vivax]CCD20693.1 hypothetical protein, conserved in T. vivax [Trypanosoma vivax Y486]|eukprot:CCD20693.1 hypothetical protein, conserved in T. vivax [Trypanosoma vivax Y486]
MIGTRFKHAVACLLLCVFACRSANCYGPPAATGVNRKLGAMEGELLCGALNFYKMWQEGVSENEKVLRSLVVSGSSVNKASDASLSTGEAQSAVETLLTVLANVRNGMEHFLLGIERDFFFPFEAIKFDKTKYVFGHTSLFVKEGRANEALLFLCNRTTVSYCRNQSWWEEYNASVSATNLTSVEAAVTALQRRSEESKRINGSLMTRVDKVLVNMTNFTNKTPNSVWKQNMTPAELLVNGCKERLLHKNHTDGFMVRVVSELVRGAKADILHESGCDTSRKLFMDYTQAFNESTFVNRSVIGDVMCGANVSDTVRELGFILENKDLKWVDVKNGALEQLCKKYKCRAKCAKIQAKGCKDVLEKEWSAKWESEVKSEIAMKFGNCTAWVHPLVRLRSRFEKDALDIQRIVERVRQLTISVLSDSERGQLNVTEALNKTIIKDVKKDAFVDYGVSLCPKREKLFSVQQLGSEDVKRLQGDSDSPLLLNDNLLKDVQKTLKTIRKQRKLHELREKEELEKRGECPHLFESFLRLLHL